MAQAAALLAETSMPAAEYLSLLDAAPADVLDEGEPGRSALRSPDWSRRMGCCPTAGPGRVPRARTHSDPLVRGGPGRGAPRTAATTVASPLAYRRMLGLLGRYSLVKLSDDDHLTVHRLTQRLLRADAAEPGRSAAAVERLLVGLAPARPDNPGTWPA